MRDLTPICLGFWPKVSCRGGALPRCWLGSLGNTASEDEDGGENGSYHDKDADDHDDIYIHFDSVCNFQLFVLPFSWLLYSLQFHSGEKGSCEARLPRPSSPVLLWQKAVQRQPNQLVFVLLIFIGDAFPRERYDVFYSLQAPEAAVLTFESKTQSTSFGFQRLVSAEFFVEIDVGPKNGTEESRSTLCFLDRTGVCVNLSTLGILMQLLLANKGGSDIIRQCFCEKVLLNDAECF